jgi:Flp pilus assembly protein TadG
VTGSGDRERGVSTVELTVLMPILLFWLMLIVQFGLWYHAKQVVTAAANQAVDTSRLPDGTERAGRADADAVLAATGAVQHPNVHVRRTATTVTAEVRADAPQLVPGIGWRVTARVVAPVERFVPEGRP